ncbi:MAG: hypothetical protein RLY31_2415 [Bacteroidota bacterium]|jgi:archaellum component FlaC
MNITRKLRNITLLAAGVAAAATMVHQTDMVRQLKHRLAGETDRADQATRELAVKNAMVEDLNTDNLRLRDSLEVLHLEIARQAETIATQQSRIDRLGKVIGDLESKVKSLSAEITRLEKTGQERLTKIGKLEQERNQLLAKMQELDQARIRADREREAALRKQEKDAAALAALQAPARNSPPKTPVLPTPPQPTASPVPKPAPAANNGPAISNDQQERLFLVNTQTKAAYRDIALRRRENGSNMSRLDLRNWQYTLISLDLQHPQPELLEGEVFMIQLLDLDNMLVIPMNEHNPEFPDSKTSNAGYRFRYRGKPLTVRYFNNQQKLGSNYEIRLFHVRDNHIFPMPQCARRIVENGSVTNT